MRRRRRRRRRLLLLANFSQLSYFDRLKLEIPFLFSCCSLKFCGRFIYVVELFFAPLFLVFLILIEMYVWMYVCMFYNFCNLGKLCEAPELISFAKFA